jgi:SAM-dependent methyltransferase
MIMASATTQSDWIDMDSRAEWPMETYMSAWRLFRRMSDENQLTARHLLSRRLWPRDKQGLRIADFGCGDGMVIEALTLASQRPFNAIHLVDIDPELLEQGRRRVEGLGIVKNLTTIPAGAEEVVRDVTRQADAALAVHLIYLLKEAQLKSFLADLAPGVPLFVVMDQPSSVFTQLWETTAPKYHKRSLNAHEIIASLKEDNYIVERTEFNTHLINPLSLRDDIRDSVLSLLCYSDFRMLDDNTQEWVKGVLTEHSALERVVCDCACYEIVRLL